MRSISANADEVPQMRSRFPQMRSRFRKCGAISANAEHFRKCGAVFRKCGRPFPQMRSHFPHLRKTFRKCGRFPQMRSRFPQMRNRFRKCVVISAYAEPFSANGRLSRQSNTYWYEPNRVKKESFCYLAYETIRYQLHTLARGCMLHAAALLLALRCCHCS